MLTCSKCGQANQPEQRFCGNCGSPLTPPAPDPRHCASCGHINDPGVRFCTSCGKPLAAQVAARTNTPPAVATYTSPPAAYPPPPAIAPTIPVQLPTGARVIAAPGGGYTCSQCGGFVRVDAEFCKHCKVGFTSARQSPPAVVGAGGATQVTGIPAAPATKSGGSKTWLWIIIGVVAVLACLFIGFMTLLGQSVSDSLNQLNWTPIVVPFV